MLLQCAHIGQDNAEILQTIVCKLQRPSLKVCTEREAGNMREGNTGSRSYNIFSIRTIAIGNRVGDSFTRADSAKGHNENNSLR